MAKSRKPDHDETRRRALRDIDRATENSETLGTSQMQRSANRARDHMMGTDNPDDDNIEIWGKRIGRILGLIFVVGLAIHIYYKYIAGAG